MPPVEKPEGQGKYEAQQQAGNQREVEDRVFATINDVSRQPA